MTDAAVQEVLLARAVARCLMTAWDRVYRDRQNETSALTQLGNLALLTGRGCLCKAEEK